MALNLVQRWQAFTESRAPRREAQTFTQRNVYIVPSRGGLGFAVVVMVLLLAAINEQLNLGYALAFLLGGVGLAGMSRSHGNVRGLTLTLGPQVGRHAGQSLQVEVLLGTGVRRQGSFSLMLSAQDQPAVWSNAPAGQTQSLSVSLPPAPRGWHAVPRLRLLSRYPLGLFTVWGYWRPAQKLLVWPAVEADAPPWPELGHGDGQQAGQHLAATHADEQLREWQRGDSLRQVAWKKSATRMASGLPPVSREGAQQIRLECWIDWADTQGLPTEARLSRLATWLVRAEQQALHDGQAYGLRVPGHELPCLQGPEHLKSCLDLLATWGQA
jgi:uncharacterized protein (DUF58 family)